MQKHITLVLEYGYDDPHEVNGKLYKVRSITNSTDYLPGELMKKEKVDMISNIKWWTVKIVGASAT